HSGKCLDVAGFGTGDGADIQQYACTGGTNQQWTRTQV
ncbi:MAG TPA: RICIN domain-containing protein, partial [Nonomuraea sp.]|nr:RICIN domain-containing protein [Nonomuraea sp.]